MHDVPGIWRRVDCDVEVGPHAEAAYAHSDTSHDKQEAPTTTIDHDNGYGSGDKLDHTYQDRYHGTVVLETSLLEDRGTVKHDCIDASTLLKEVEGHADCKRP